jgi:ribosome biogenesis GTPase
LAKPDLTSGIIIETGFQVKVLSENGSIFVTKLKNISVSGREKSITKVTLGDEVLFELLEEIALIHEIKTPRTILSRESVRYPYRSKIMAANLDQVFIIISHQHPDTPLGLVDRMIVAVLSGGMQVVLVQNKIDLPLLGEDTSLIYRQAGFTVLETSTKSKAGLKELTHAMQHKKSLFLGVSGVGKTSLVKEITGIDLVTAHDSVNQTRGHHITTYSKFYQLNQDTFIADIPGIKQLGFVGQFNSGLYFPDITKFSQLCAYSNCSHTSEPNCQVKMALQSGQIHSSRFLSFKKIQEEIREKSYA